MSWDAGAEPGGLVIVLGHPAPSRAPSRALRLQVQLSPLSTLIDTEPFIYEGGQNCINLCKI